MSRPNLHLPGAVLVAASLVLAGCSASTDADDRVWPMSPRLDLYRYGQHDTIDDNRVQELIATCMKEHGFDYTPQLIEIIEYTPSAYDPVAEAKEYGYGVTPPSKAEYAQRGSAAVMDAFAKAADENAAYVNGLSERGQELYHHALYGDYQTVHNSAGEEVLLPAGCTGEADAEVYGEFDPAAEPDSTVIDEYYAYVEDKVDNDPRVHAARKAWVSCMAGKGYDFLTSDKARDSIVEQLAVLVASSWDSPDWDPDWDQVTDAELAALHAEEVTLATADAQCAVTAGVTQAADDALFDAETTFYNAHETDVEAWFTAHEHR